jgi:hypothetical protein
MHGCVISVSWTYTKREGVAVLHYRKLEDVIDKFAPDSTAANLAKNFNAMVDMLYKVLSRDDLKSIYTGKSAVLFMVKHSFISKLHNYCQEFQMVLIIVTQFFLDHVSHHHGDAKYWMKVISSLVSGTKTFFNFVKTASCYLIRKLAIW